MMRMIAQFAAGGSPMANWRHPEKNRPRRVTREVAAPMMNMTTPLNPAPTQTAVASLMNRKGSSGTAAPAAKSRNDVPPAIQAEPPRPSGSMPSFSRATTSRATRRLLKRPSTTRPAWRSLRPFSSKLPASSRFSFCGARWIARDSAATCASLNSRDVLTESHSPMAIEQAPAMSPARPDTSNACAEIPAPKTPATRLRLETRPSLAPSTAARRALPPPAVSSFFFFALLGMAIVIALASGAWASQAPRMYRRGQHGEDRENRRGMANGIDPRAVPHRTPEGHRAGFHRGILGQQIARHVCLRLLRPTALFRRHQIRFRHRLAELLPAVGERGGQDRSRSQPIHGPDRSDVRQMRRASRSRFSRRSEADRSALLHQLRRAQADAEEIAVSFPPSAAGPGRAGRRSRSAR